MSILKDLSERLASWDEQAEKYRAELGQLAGEKKQQAEATMEELKKKATEVRSQIEELRGKEPDELSNEAKAKVEELSKKASGEIGNRLEQLAAFFKGKAGEA